MDESRFSALRSLSLSFLVSGLAGLIISATMSIHYLNALPRFPEARTMRMTPRNIHGVIVYQSAEENRKLNVIEYSSIGVFLTGLGLGLVYFRKWGMARAIGVESEEP